MKFSRTLLVCLFLFGATFSLRAGVMAPADDGQDKATGNESEIAAPQGGSQQVIDVAQRSIAEKPTSISAATASVTLVGSYISLFTVPNDYASNSCSGTRKIWFDGPISPVSYKATPSSTPTVSVLGALSGTNQQIVGAITSGGAISHLFSPNACVPSYTSVFSNDVNSFEWGEWLYGTFFNAATKKMYSTMYNEFYGPNGYTTHQGWYSADGLAISTNFGKTFFKIAPAPAHVIARPTFLFRPGDTNRQIGYGGVTSIVLSPKDNYFYAFTGFTAADYSFSANCLMRTNNLDDPTSWRVWNGSGFNGAFFPPNQAPGYDATTNIQIPLGPLYLGWNQYFQRFIAVGWFGNSWGFTLSDNLIDWSPGVAIITPPANNLTFGYPSLVDPSMLQNTSDSRAASNNYSGQTPYLAYVQNDSTFGSPGGGPFRQQLRIQKISFSGGSGPVAPPALQNISVRGIVGPGDKNLIAGFQIVGPGNPKTIIIRGMGPSLGGGFNNPTISLYNSAGTLVASNTGWRNNSSTNLALLSAFAPGNDGDSALVYGNFTPGAYTAVLSGGGGLGLIELYDVTLQSSNPALNSKLAGFSARGYVQSGTGTMIMGFILSGPRQAVVRATSLSTLPSPLSPLLADPLLTLYTGGTQIASNDNWQTDPNHTQISNYGLAPGNYYESAMLPSVGAGAYTLTLSGHSNAPDGYALLEYYDVTP